MKTNIFTTLMILAIFSSCSTAYRTGQTPDDVYFSPAKNTYVVSTSDNNNQSYDYGYQQLDEERNIRMGINDPRWRNFYDDYSYSPYYYGYNYDYYYNPCYYPYPVYVLNYNPYYNPYYSYYYPNNHYFFNPVNTTPRMTNLSAYRSGYNNSNTSSNTNSNRSVNRTYQNYYNNINNRPASSSSDRNNNSNNNNQNNNSDRNYSPSSGSSNSSSGGGVSRPARNGRN